MAAERIIAIGFTMGGVNSAYFGADPCVGSNTATSSPMLPEAANPGPPTTPANASERMSPNRFKAPTTLYSSEFFCTHIIYASLYVDHSALPRELSATPFP